MTNKVTSMTELTLSAMEKVKSVMERLGGVSDLSLSALEKINAATETTLSEPPKVSSVRPAHTGFTDLCRTTTCRTNRFTSASRTVPAISVNAFAAPQATPYRTASGNDLPCSNCRQIPAVIASPLPIGFTAFNFGDRY